MDGIFLVLALAIAVSGPVAFLLALAARARLAVAERRIAALEAELRAAGLREVARLPGAPVIPDPLGGAEEAPTFAEATKVAAEPKHRPADLPPPPPFFSPPPIEAPARGLEERLGAHWTVLVGGVALALGGLLLVRYSIEQGYFGPAARCALGLAFGVALAVAGEFLRRREKASGYPTQTPAVLTAAGTVAAFGAIYAAHGLYGLIGPSVAFVALGAIALAAILAAVLHGPSLAGLGLVGAGVAPFLVAAPEPNPWPVVLYLAIVTGAAHTLARLRRWLWLACAAVGVGALWAVVFALEDSTDFFHAGLVQALVSATFAAVFVAFLPHAGTKDENLSIDPIATAVVGVFAAAGCLVLATASVRGPFDLPIISLAGALVAGLAATGARIAPVAGLAPIAGALAFVVLHLWPGDDQRPVHLSTLLTLYEPLESTRFMIFAAVGAMIVAGLGTGRLAVGRALPPSPASLYAIGAAVTPLAILGLAYLRLSRGQTGMAFAIVAGLLATAFALLAQYFRRGDEAGAFNATRLALGAFATASLAALALGLVFVLDRGMLTVALALAALAAAAISARLDIGALRWASAAMGLVVLARLILEARIVGGDLGTTPILNWLLFGYGVPALAFGFAVRLMRRAGGEDPPVRVAQSLSILFAAFLVFFEIRHALNGGNPYARSSRLIEQGLFATAALLFSLTLTRLDAARSSPVFRVASFVFGAISVGVAALGLVAYANPYLSCRPIEGGAVFNGLLLGYAAPAIVAAMLMSAARGVRPAWFTTGAGALSIALLFLYACLETRRLFQDSDICSIRGQSDTEIWAYSAVWLGLGVLLLLYGIARGARGARLASGIFVLAAVLKIFLYDLSDLEGLMRAFSFIGLGVVLIGIGLVYQKLVFRNPAKPAIAVERET
jgi:uncharacterized membrane protein